jgi:hypothetical protein
MIRPFPKAHPRKSASKGRKKEKSRIPTDKPNKEEIEMLKSSSRLRVKSVRRRVKRKLIVEESEHEDDEHMSCRNSADEDVNMQELLEQETAEDIIEEDVTALIRGEKTPKDVLCFGKILRDVGQYVVFIYQNELFPGKLSVMMKKEQVSSTKRSLESWKWPEKEDIHGRTFWEALVLQNRYQVEDYLTCRN